ncbi:MAG TPA: ABC transporter permease [Dehalococcoidia bacterium]|nr:ABC transporter permease [Dehalococcoidia bacterium]
MREYMLRRLLTMVPVLLLISLIGFALLYLLPGDPALAILGDQIAADKQLYERLRREMHLDDPVYVQYVRWLGQIVQGNLGTSVMTREPVLEMILFRLPITLQLGMMALCLAVAIGLSAAIVSALRPGSKLDFACSVLALAGVAMPNFWLGVLLIYLLSVWLQLLPPTGFTPFREDPGLNLKMMLMPAITLGTGLAAIIMRQARSALLEVLHQDYVRTARAKGLYEQQVIVGHALKNAMIPIATIIGLQLGNLFAGAAISETIFAIPGIGRMVVEAIFFRDYPVAQEVDGEHRDKD